MTSAVRVHRHAQGLALVEIRCKLLVPGTLRIPVSTFSPVLAWPQHHGAA